MYIYIYIYIQLILDISNDKGSVDRFVRESTFALRRYKHFL